ncbi:hypothetical protein EYF80_040496 [Liparis tanakae]|uniref:Uncharacterized protein n=1 Tax=Liparis tanakae TaxID=230148 RepID=A0A4Z2G7Z0_9TELE|nr:hypothetical protein EYF80_040496 [Liparis tanakae]
MNLDHIQKEIRIPGMKLELIDGVSMTYIMLEGLKVDLVKLDPKQRLAVVLLWKSLCNYQPNARMEPYAYSIKSASSKEATLISSDCSSSSSSSFTTSSSAALFTPLCFDSAVA